MRTRNKDPRVEVTCVECAVKFIRKQSLIRGVNQFCSATCMGRWNAFTPAKADRFFWPKVKRGTPSECWPYHRLDKLGYGRFNKQGPYAFAHRTAWIIAHGDIPAGMDVMHSCDNRSCCNVAHLSLGTHDDNMRDMAVKGRSGIRKLNPDQVRDIRAAWATGGVTQVELARQYGLKPQTIGHAIHGKNWKHVQPK